MRILIVVKAPFGESPPIGNYAFESLSTIQQISYPTSGISFILTPVVLHTVMEQAQYNKQFYSRGKKCKVKRSYQFQAILILNLITSVQTLPDTRKQVLISLETTIQPTRDYFIKIAVVTYIERENLHGSQKILFPQCHLLSLFE